MSSKLRISSLALAVLSGLSLSPCLHAQSIFGTLTGIVSDPSQAAVPQAAVKLVERLKNGGGSYLSSHDPREILGLGASTRVDELEIHWPSPSKRVEKLKDIGANRYIRIAEGKGIV